MNSKFLFVALSLLLGNVVQAHAACNATLVESFVGKAASEENMNAAVKAAGARAYQKILPDKAQDKSTTPDRLNIYTDAAGTITSLSCSPPGIKLQPAS